MRPPRLTSSLFGSLGAHGCFLVWGLFGFHAVPRTSTQADAWVGNDVELDTTPEPVAAHAVPDMVAATADATSEGPAPEATRTDAARNEPTVPALKLADAMPSAAPARHTAKPNPLPRRAPVSSASDAPSSPTTDAPSDPATNSRSGGAFGSEGLPAGVRNLPSAFTRAITRAASLDPVWRTLSAGRAGDFTIDVTVDEPGHIASAEFERPAPAAPIAPELTRLRDRVVALLGGGQFALSTGSGAGSERLHISINLADAAPSEQDNPEDVLELGFDPPRSGNVGRAHFRLGSGRHFEATVVVMTRAR